MKSETDPSGALATAVDGGGAATSKTATASFSPGDNIWILNWWHDLLFFVATPVLLIPAVLLLQSRSATASIYLTVLTFGAVGHHLPCFLRAYGDRDLFHQYRMRFLLAPAIMLGVGFGFAFAGWDGLSVILLFWGFWHVLAQQYGFLRIYDAKVGSFERTTIRLDFLMCFFWFGAGVVYSPERMYQLLDRFYAAGGPLLDATWVNACQLLWGFLTVVVTIAFVMNYVYQRRQGQTASLVKLTTMAAGIGLWWFCMVSVHDLLLGILLFELFHDTQYLALVRYCSCGRVEHGRHFGPLPSQLFRRGLPSLALYLAVVLLYGLPAFLTGISPAWLEYDASSNTLFKTVYALVAASTLLHFYYDSFLWRIRDKDMRKTLELADARPGIHAAWPLAERVPHLLQWSLLIVLAAWIGFFQWRSDGPAERTSVNIVEAVPTSWEARARWGAELLEQGQELLEQARVEEANEYLKEAVEQLQEATELRPDVVGPLCDLGRVLRQIGRLPESLEHFEKAINIEPDSVQAQWEYGNTLFGLGEWDEGREHLRRAAELAPDNASIHYDLALALAKGQRQNLGQALVSINAAIKLDESKADAYNARATIYLNRNDLQQAMSDYGKALQLDPQLVKAYRNRAQVWMASGDVQHTIADLNEAIKLDGRTSLDFVIRGDMFYSLKQFDKARADYAEAILCEETHPEPLERMIMLLTTCPDASYRNPEQAIALAHTLCKPSDFSDARALQRLVETCALADQYDQAIRWQERAIPLVPPEVRREMRKRIEEFKQARANQQKKAEGGQGESGVQGNESTPADRQPKQ